MQYNMAWHINNQKRVILLMDQNLIDHRNWYVRSEPPTEGQPDFEMYEQAKKENKEKVTLFVSIFWHNVSHMINKW
jgi:hypothetical protein